MYKRQVLVLGCYWVLRGERNKFKIQQIKQEIERNKEKADMNLKFFTHVSHELRTPLTLIISPLETLMKEDVYKRQDEKSGEAFKKAGQVRCTE